MSSYKYKAIDSNGNIRTGIAYGVDIVDVEQRLRKLKLDVIDCAEKKYSFSLLSRKKLSRQELINFVFQLEQLVKAGVPLLEALHDLRDSEGSDYYRDLIASIVESIEGGKSFSAALDDFPQDFDVTFRCLISVGEESGDLPRIFHDIGVALRWIDEINSAAKKMIIYPSIVAVVIFLVAAFLMVFVVPQIIPFVEEMGTEIPSYTLALIATSIFFQKFWWLIIAFPFVIALVIRVLSEKNESFRLIFDQLKLKIPIFGNIILKIKLARFANYFALMYESGITVLRSIEICQTLVDNKYIEGNIYAARENIADGLAISEGFSSIEFFPPLVVRMIKIGETTGQLDIALKNVGYFYTREVDDAIESIQPAINPLLTVVLGILLGWIMMSVLGPVWDSIAAVA